MATTGIPAELRDQATAGFDSVIGLAVVEASGDEVRSQLTVRPELLQPHGILHGGVLCAVVESVASVGGTLWLSDAGVVVGVNNNTDFLRATKDGAVLTAVGTPIHRGRSQQLWAVHITDGDGHLVAKGQVRLQNLRQSERATK